MKMTKDEEIKLAKAIARWCLNQWSLEAELNDDLVEEAGELRKELERTDQSRKAWKKESYENYGVIRKIKEESLETHVMIYHRDQQIDELNAKLELSENGRKELSEKLFEVEDKAQLLDALKELESEPYSGACSISPCLMSGGRNQWMVRFYAGDDFIEEPKVVVSEMGVDLLTSIKTAANKFMNFQPKKDD